MVVEIDEDLRQGFLTIFNTATFHDVVTLPLFRISIDAGLESALIHFNDIKLFKLILNNTA